MSEMASEIAGVSIVGQTVYWGSRSMNTTKLRVTGLCQENPSVTGWFPTQRPSDAENVSISWRHHILALCVCVCVCVWGGGGGGGGGGGFDGYRCLFSPELKCPLIQSLRSHFSLNWTKCLNKQLSFWWLETLCRLCMFYDCSYTTGRDYRRE